MEMILSVLVATVNRFVLGKSVNKMDAFRSCIAEYSLDVCMGLSWSSEQCFVMLFKHWSTDLQVYAAKWSEYQALVLRVLNPLCKPVVVRFDRFDQLRDERRCCTQRVTFRPAVLSMM